MEHHVLTIAGHTIYTFFNLSMPIVMQYAHSKQVPHVQMCQPIGLKMHDQGAEQYVMN